MTVLRGLLRPAEFILEISLYNHLFTGAQLIFTSRHSQSPIANALHILLNTDEVWLFCLTTVLIKLCFFCVTLPS